MKLLEESCCTCATRLSAVPRIAEAGAASSTSESESESENEKRAFPIPGPTPVPVPVPDDRRLGCCARVICGNCIHKNGRFASYCPYCQISTGPSSLPATGLKDPPAYSGVPGAKLGRPPSPNDVALPQPPPPYSPPSTSSTTLAILPQGPPLSSSLAAGAAAEKAATATAAATQPDPEPILHFLDHARDTIPSLSLRYGIPASTLRHANRLGSDHLLLGRKVIVIPSSSISSSSLSPRPVESDEEARRKARIRRWMVTCKEADYDVAVLYLEQAGYDLDAAVEAYFADEEWERENPVGEGGWRRRGSSIRVGAGAGADAAGSSSSSRSWQQARGRFGFGGGAGEGGWLWASQAAFLRRDGGGRGKERDRDMGEKGPL